MTRSRGSSRLSPRLRALGGVVAGAALLGALLVSAGLLPRASAGRDEGLRYAPSWAEAVAQARERGALIFATFHKDN